jgi:plasmid stabilization system protein ParE
VDFRIRFSEDALDDLREILAYSWANFPETTEQFGETILSHIDMLARFPYLGKPSARGGAYRILVHTPFQVIYEVLEQDRVIEILHVRHSSRL